MNRVDAIIISFFVLFILMGVFYFANELIKMKKELLRCEIKQKNELVDNNLIKVNDSVYYRIHVRIDTTYYYANQESTKEATK